MGWKGPVTAGLLLLLLAPAVSCSSDVQRDPCGRLYIEGRVSDWAAMKTNAGGTKTTGTIECWCQSAQEATCLETTFESSAEACIRDWQDVSMCEPEEGFEGAFSTDGTSYPNREVMTAACQEVVARHLDPGPPCP